MPTLTDYARNMLARALCARAPTLPSSVYLALGTGAGPTGLTGEPAGNGYIRQRVTFTGTGLQRNADAVRFVFNGSFTVNGAATTLTLTHLCLYDALSGGNPLAYGALAQNAAITGPGTVTVAADSLTIDSL